MKIEPVLIAGRWQAADYQATFQAENPATATPLSSVYPVSSWQDCDTALSAAAEAATILRQVSSAQIAGFLRRFAERIEARSAERAQAT